MPDYKKTKIYYIEVGNDRYYGHTTQRLCSRKAGHIQYGLKHPTQRVYKAILDAGMNIQDLTLTLVEHYPCNSKQEAILRERYYIKKFSTLNQAIPLRSRKEYYQDNKEVIKEKVRQARRDNPEKFKEQDKRKHLKQKETNPERLKEYSRKYLNENREKERHRLKEWASNNREKENERHRKLYADNIDKERERSRLYRLRKKQEKATLST